MDKLDSENSREILQEGFSNEGFTDEIEFHLHSNAPIKETIRKPTSLIPLVTVRDGDSKVGDTCSIDSTINNEASHRSETPERYQNINGSISSKISIISNDRRVDRHSKKWVVDLKPNTNKQEDEFVVQRKRRFHLSYEYLVWFIFFTVTTLCIVDRFVYKGDTVLQRKGKRVSKLWGSNFGETVTNIVWAVTARLIITSQNLMFYTTLWCIPNIISEYAPRIISISGIRDVHIKIHRIAGIFLIGIPTLAHVLVIFLPPLVDKTQLTYSPPSNFNYSSQLGHLNWTTFWDPAAVENWTFNDVNGVHLTSDEIYRLTLMIALFCFLFPLTRSSYLNDRSYSLAIGLHAVAGVWYAVDNIRKITHGLSHVFNLPFLILWCLDRLLSIILYRLNFGRIVKKNVIGNNGYIELRVKLNKARKSCVGDIYFLDMNTGKFGLPSLERAHPFTSFSNHSLDSSWDVGFLVSVMDDDMQWFPSWTRKLRNIEDNFESSTIKTWGPYRSSGYQLYQELEMNDKTSYTLFASGSGFGYLLDVLGILAYKERKNSTNIPTINIYYTVRYSSVIIQFRGHVEKLIDAINKKETAVVNFNWYLTGTEGNGNAFDLDERHESMKFHTGRINIDKIISTLQRTSPVYFVGRPSLADRIEKVCNKSNITLIKDFTNSQRGQSDRNIMMGYIKKTLSVIVFTLGVCILLSLYIHIK